jgi:hypothetical protein
MTVSSDYPTFIKTLDAQVALSRSTRIAVRVSPGRGWRQGPVMKEAANWGGLNATLLSLGSVLASSSLAATFAAMNRLAATKPPCQRR